MRKYYPPSLEHSEDRDTGYILIYEGMGRGDQGKTIDDVIRERVPVALLDTEGYSVHERMGRVFDFRRGTVRPIIEVSDYNANSTHWVQFRGLQEVYSFLEQHYRYGLRFLPAAPAAGRN